MLRHSVWQRRERFAAAVARLFRPSVTGTSRRRLILTIINSRDALYQLYQQRSRRSCWKEIPSVLMCGCAGRRDKVDHQTTAAGSESTDSVPAAATAAMRLHVRRARRACVPRCAARISSNYGRWCARHAERAIIQTAQHASRARRRRRRCTHARANCRRLSADEQKQRRTPTGALRRLPVYPPCSWPPSRSAALVHAPRFYCPPLVICRHPSPPPLLLLRLLLTTWYSYRGHLPGGVRLPCHSGSSSDVDRKAELQRRLMSLFLRHFCEHFSVVTAFTAAGFTDLQHFGPSP